MDFNRLSVEMEKKFSGTLNTDILSVPTDFTITAHTGAMHTKPNSLHSAKKCIACGADIIEVDVTQRPDGSFVLIHKSAAKSNEGIPFEYLLKLIDGKNVKLNIDLKSFDNIERMQSIIEDNNLIGKAFFTGVGEKEIEAIRKTAPKIPTFINMFADMRKTSDRGYCDNMADQIQNYGAIGLNTNFMRLDSNIVCAMHSKGLLVSAWTVNEKRAMKRMIDIGVDNITTKKPLLLCKLIGR